MKAAIIAGIIAKMVARIIAGIVIQIVAKMVAGIIAEIIGPKFKCLALHKNVNIGPNGRAISISS